MRFIVEADALVAEHVSGIGHATLEMVRALSRLAQKDDKVCIVIPFGKKEMLKHHNLPSSIIVRQLPPFYKYVNYVLTRTSLPIPMDLIYGPGVYVFPNYKTWYVPFSRALTFVHDVAFKIMPEVTHERNLAYLNANFSRWLQRADVILAISEQTKREIARFFPAYAYKLEKVYLGVDPTVYYPRQAEEVAAALEKYGIAYKYFLYVGNIEPRKNLLQLLDAYKRYCDKYQHDTQLVIIGGDGWKNQDIVNKIEQMNREGYDIYRPRLFVEDDDLPAIYSGCQALVHLARHEGYGLSLVQAQACGAVVIASELPVFKETLNSDGVAYVDADNINQIAIEMGQVDELRLKVNSLALHTWDDTARSLRRLGSGR